jgi:hypothetical protein
MLKSGNNRDDTWFQQAKALLFSRMDLANFAMSPVILITVGISFFALNLENTKREQREGK